MGCFKPCFRWSAPYTIDILVKVSGEYQHVLNLVLDGRLLIQQNKFTRLLRKVPVLNLVLDGRLLIPLFFDFT